MDINVQFPNAYFGELEVGQPYSVPNFANSQLVSTYVWIDSRFDREKRERGVLFLTKEEAAECTKTFIRIQGGEL